MQISALFPAGSRVCLTRSGDTPRGFYAWYGIDEQGCPERGDRAATRMVINSTYNANFHTSLEEVHPPDCKPLDPVVREATRQDLRLRGRRSQICQYTAPGGRLELLLTTFGGTQSDGFPRAPDIVYNVNLETSRGRLERDLPMFRTFLANLRLAPEWRGSRR
jgi:hypothetical protein